MLTSSSGGGGGGGGGGGPAQDERPGPGSQQSRPWDSTTGRQYRLPVSRPHVPLLA